MTFHSCKPHFLATFFCCKSHTHVQLLCAALLHHKPHLLTLVEQVAEVREGLSQYIESLGLGAGSL